MSTFTEADHPRETGGQFAAKERTEASDVNLGADDEDRVPRRPDGSIDVTRAVADGLVTGFSDRAFETPQTRTLVGHWDGNTIVVEYQLDGDEQDDRPDTGYWPEGLWASSATGMSETEIAAGMIDEYEECDSIRVALYDDDYTPAEDEEDEDWNDEVGED